MPVVPGTAAGGEVAVEIAWGVVVLVAGLTCWLGQAIAASVPATAVKLGLTEPERDVDPGVHADTRGEAWWDTAITWPLPVAGVLLIIDHGWWPYFGLFGGAVYTYATGRWVFTRQVMLARGIRVGTPAAVRTGRIAFAIWGAIAVVTMIAAVAALAA
ncbi:MAG: hypothetical protein HKP61_08755 [Dactylosporangium sp.]|nr:hypothetical protein [Dactylosporangium sp.]NNJ61024.1 hypothetical protein [Dactylosporangium sp.]